MNSVLRRQYSVVLDAIEVSHPADYLSLLRCISDAGSRIYYSAECGFVPHPVSELISDLVEEGLVEKSSNYNLTSSGQSFLRQTKE